MIKDVEKYFVSLNDDINHTIRILNDGKAQVALVVDHKKSLVGIVTDGDIRRAFLNGKNLNDCVSDVMTTNPITLLNGATEVDAVEKVKQIYSPCPNSK